MKLHQSLHRKGGLILFLSPHSNRRRGWIKRDKALLLRCSVRLPLHPLRAPTKERLLQASHSADTEGTTKTQPSPSPQATFSWGDPREQTSTLMSGGPITEENKAGQRKERALRASLSRETSEMRQLTLGEVFQAKALRL